MATKTPTKTPKAPAAKKPAAAKKAPAAKKAVAAKPAAKPAKKPAAKKVAAKKPPKTTTTFVRNSATKKAAVGVRAVSTTLAAKAEEVGLPGLVKWLASKTDEPRMDKAIKMLKADKFQLFSEVTETEVDGVVHSQKIGLDKVYSCRLQSDGGYLCADQTLELCMGMNGYPCKHLMVLMVGLAQGGKLKEETIKSWVSKAVGGGRNIDISTEKLAAVFIKYKGAQAGELDWRPTETIPEDFYAL
jgi:hypothetical protein